MYASIYNIKFDFTDADVTEDSIDVDILPTNLPTGSVDLYLDGCCDPQYHFIAEDLSRSGGTYDESFDIPNLPEHEYWGVIYDYTIDGNVFWDYLDYHIYVLGDYENTRYNIPDEDDCSSGSTDTLEYTSGTCATVGSCSYSSASHKLSWLNALFLNGSGYGSDSEYYTIEWYCNGGQSVPFKTRRIPTQGCVACGGATPTVDYSVACWTGHNILYTCALKFRHKNVNHLYLSI